MVWDNRNPSRNEKWTHPSIEFTNKEKEYDSLRDFLNHNDSLYITDELGQRREEIECVLGSGMYKTAHKLSGNRILLLPNRCTRGVFSRPKWEQMVKGEAEACKILKSANLLSPGSKLVGVSTSENSKKIMGLVGFNFLSFLESKKCYIIDGKDSSRPHFKKSSTWIRGEHFIFPADDARLIPSNWTFATDELIEDILCLARLNLNIDSDCASLAITKIETSSDSLNKYKIRYFGFDFSTDNNTSKIHLNEDFHPKLSTLLFSIDLLMSQFFYYEFCDTPTEKMNVVNQLQEAVKQDCLKRALAKIEQEACIPY